MPRTVDPRRLQKKTSQTMLAAQRRGVMEGNRLTRRISELQAVADSGARSWGRDYRQAEQQLSLANLVLSDHVIDVQAISGDRPRAPSADERRRRLAECLGGGGGGESGETGGRLQRRRRQRRPSSVFGAQIDRQRQLREEQQQQTEATGKQADQPQTADSQQQQAQAQQAQAQQAQAQQAQAQQALPVPCMFAGSGGAPCRRFPCCLPQTYSFLSNKREMLQLYDLLLSHLPPHKRPQSGASDAGSDLGSMISDAEFLIGAQRRVSTLDPVERARLLRQAVDDWKRRHSRQAPEPRETRYGKPYPMRRILKPISCSGGSFFLN